MSRAQFERFVGLGREEVGRGAHVEKLACLAGVDPEPLRAVTPTRDVGSRTVHLGRAWTDVADLTGRAFRVCTSCIAADREAARRSSLPVQVAAWARPEWFVRSIATCVVHRRTLIGKCHDCSAMLGEDNPAIDTCRCGSLQLDRPAPPAINRVDEVLGAMICGKGPPSFATAGLHHVSAHLKRLGCLTLGRHEHLPALTAVEALALREVGLNIMRAGDGRLSELLDEIVLDAPPGRSGKCGLVSSYGWVWRSWLGTPTANPLDRTLRDKVRSHAERSGIRSPLARDGLTLKDVRTILRSGHGRARRLVAGAGLLSGAELPGTPMSIEPGRIGEIAAELGDLLDGGAAARHLGIGRSQFRSLAAAGLVQPSELAAALDGRSGYRLDGLHRLVDDVCRDTPILPRAPAECVPLPMACRDASIPLAVVLRAMLNGHVAPVARTAGHGLDAVWVAVRDLRAFSPVATGTAAHAGRRLGLHYEAARWLTREGILGDAPGVVDPAYVERFGASFCTSAQIGRMLAVTPKAAAAACRSAGLKPTFGPPACRQAIWSKDAVRATFCVRLERAC